MGDEAKALYEAAEQAAREAALREKLAEEQARLEKRAALQTHLWHWPIFVVFACFGTP